MTGSWFITINAFIQSVKRGTSQNNQAFHEIDLRSESTNFRKKTDICKRNMQFLFELI